MRLLICMLFCLAICAPAQVQIRFYSAHAKGSLLPPECVQEGEVLSGLVKRFHSPSWTWFIACDDASWAEITDHVGFDLRDVNRSGRILAATDLTGHMTYVRGYALFGRSQVASPERIIAHELGHILLNTHDEFAAERQAEVMERWDISR